ncbi:MAG TPA: hypothetical protein DEQ43_13320 [Nocardioides bacterium]|nr:hypothetical protein [Nocardioides sp.]
MTRGDHLYVRRGRRYTHHGIDCGDGTVIHYGGLRRAGRRVERTSLESFAAGGPVLVRSYRRRLPVDEIVAAAESRLGAKGYHLVRNNCEHFATWASTGSARSRQVRGWAVAAPSAVASVGVADAAGVHMMVLGTISMGAYALTKPLRRRRDRSAATDEADRSRRQRHQHGDRYPDDQRREDGQQLVTAVLERRVDLPVREVDPQRCRREDRQRRGEPRRQPDRASPQE